MQPEISPDLLNIMEQRFSAIKYRANCLDNLINQVMQFWFFLLFFLILNSFDGSSCMFNFMIMLLIWFEMIILCIIDVVDWRQPEVSPSEYARANKELRKLSGSVELINELKDKQKVILCFCGSVGATCFA